MDKGPFQCIKGFLEIKEKKKPCSKEEAPSKTHITLENVKDDENFLCAN